MSVKKSAGLLVFRLRNARLEFFLVHPGGPYWAGKDAGAWTIPKGEFGDDESALEAAIREFKEETGFGMDGEFMALGAIRQKSGKVVYAWAVEGDVKAEEIQSNTFEIEWPPRSGKMKKFPEVDKGEWFSFLDAKEKINPAQFGFLQQVKELLEKKS
jgi:predicted NUDIX family NTP pyrophosphohydrolase